MLEATERENNMNNQPTYTWGVTRNQKPSRDYTSFILGNLDRLTLAVVAAVALSVTLMNWGVL
jgi:hypothetical protein